MKYTVRKSVVHVLGYIWQPGIGPCGQVIELNEYQIGCMREGDDPIRPIPQGPITRDSVSDWLDTNAGDFSSITDFWASIENGDETVEIAWADEEHEMTFWDCVNGSDMEMED